MAKEGGISLSPRRKTRSSSRVSSSTPASHMQTQQPIPVFSTSEEPISRDSVISSLPGRKSQIIEVLRLIGPLNSPTLPLLLYGGPSTGKTVTILQIFRHLNRPFIYADCRTCYCPRILFHSVLSQLLLYERNSGKWNSGAKRCEKQSEFVDLLRNALLTAVNTLRERKKKLAAEESDKGEMIYLVFDNVELLRSWERSSSIIRLLFRLHDILKIPEVGIIYISSSSPEAYYSSHGSIEPLTVYFPDYTLEDLHDILLTSNQSNPKLFSTFLSVVLKPFYRVTRRVDELSVSLQPLFLKYCEPLSDQILVPDEAMKRRLFDNLQSHLVASLNNLFMVPHWSSHQIKSDRECSKKRSRKSGSNELDFHMSMSMKYLLLSAFIASRNPATLDAALFDSSGCLSNRKRKRFALYDLTHLHLRHPVVKAEMPDAMLLGSKNYPSFVLNRSSMTSMNQKDNMAEEILLKGPGTFPLERLLAIFQCIAHVGETMAEDEQIENCITAEGGSVGLTSDVLLELSSLCIANFICKGGSCPLEGSSRYRCIIDEEMAVKVARSINFPLSSYLYRR